MSRSKKKKSGAGLGIVFLLVLLIGGFFAASHVYSNLKDTSDAFDPSAAESIAVTIPSGATTDRIASILEGSGIIQSAKNFKLKVKLNDLDGKFQAGDYLLSPAMTSGELMEALQKGRSAAVRFTVPEGYTVNQTAEKLTEDGILASPQDFYEALAGIDDYWFLEGIAAAADPTGEVPAAANRFEGFLYPETYEIAVGSSAETVARRMLDEFDCIFTPLYEEAKDPATGQVNGRSVKEIVTIASLVERESKVAEDRPLIASVIYNRLQKGMQLQIDATVLYARGEWKDRVLYSDLGIDSPYNTYKISGLPAGPIASAGEASLKAAISPASTNYIYYVLKADGSGGHNFAENAADFQKYKNEYINSLGN